LNAQRFRLGVYGGAFDPPHLAHHALAQVAIRQLALDQLRIFPTGQAWHKARQPSDVQHRLAMARLAFADLPKVQVDARETVRLGATYTIDTLLELQAEHPSAELFLLMGADQFQAFSSWHRSQDIAEIATICVAARAISTSQNSQNTVKNAAQTTCKMWELNMPAMDISATQVRGLVRQGLRVDHLVNTAVARYIAQHHLYST
jgi:nicotinate-nucleotide adenylyltransferase